MGQLSIAKSPRTAKQRMMRLGVSLGGIYLLTCVLLFWQQRRFIFAPSRMVKSTPADYELTYEDVNLDLLAVYPFGNRREKIHGWWIPAQNPNAKTILYLHGNGLNIGANAEQANRFNQLGLSVFLFDYRGYGKSEGDFPSETTVYADAERAWDYLVEERKIEPRNIAIYGHSLGGAIAIDLATRHPDASGLIVQSSFTSTVDMARRNWWTAVFPVNVLMNQRFDSIQKVPQLKLPTLYIHGTSDELILFEMSQRLYRATRSFKSLKLFPGAGHNNVAQVGGSIYAQAVQTFIHRNDPDKVPDKAPAKFSDNKFSDNKFSDKNPAKNPDKDSDKDLDKRLLLCGNVIKVHPWNLVYGTELRGKNRHPFAPAESNLHPLMVQDFESFPHWKERLTRCMPDPGDTQRHSSSPEQKYKEEPLW